ncbi:MAG: Phosphoenolpyruvate-protein phosphotransferase [Verrucomicrobiota bacterium]|jgi:phosphotransferase system enzyme I (PtsI)
MGKTLRGSKPETRFQGIAVSPGIALGNAWVHRSDDEPPPHYHIRSEDVPDELTRFEAALLQTQLQIQEMQSRISESVGGADAGIFDAHLLVVEDRMVIDEVVRTIKRDLLNVESVFAEVTGRYAKILSEIDDPYLRERAVDIHDVCRRVMRNLMGKQAREWGTGGEPHVLIAHNLTPSDTVQMDRRSVIGFATDVGSKTSHTAIMARSLNIPAVVALHNVSETLVSGDPVLLDGYNGLLILNPSQETLWKYSALEDQKEEVAQRLSSLRETECKTRDGRLLTLSANIELPEDVPMVIDSGASGVGLFRTEFFYINRQELPSEDLQYKAYRSVVERLTPNSVIIRTLDLGGDKLMSSLNLPTEMNPFLGWRAIRLCLERVDVFKTQLRAILRASAHGNVRIMYPMISGVEEVRKANAILNECREELRQEGVSFAEKIEVGAMIEIPSAALSADLIAREVDFFSIGTNDLIQYSIAVDRLNEQIAHLYQPTHPAIVRLIRMVVDAGHAHNLWVGVCGEMAGEVVLTPLLLGLGVDELSTGCAQVPRVKRAVQSLDLAQCVQLVEEIRHLESASAIYAACERVAREHYPDLL